MCDTANNRQQANSNQPQETIQVEDARCCHAKIGSGFNNLAPLQGFLKKYNYRLP